MNNLFSFGCPQHVYRTSPNNNNRTPEATAATARVGAAVPSAATVVPPIRRRLSTSTANIFRRLFGLPTKYKSLKSRAIVLSTATMASSIEATPNRGPSKQQNQISGQLYKYTNVVKGRMRFSCASNSMNVLIIIGLLLLLLYSNRMAVSLVHGGPAGWHIELLLVRDYG